MAQPTNTQDAPVIALEGTFDPGTAAALRAHLRHSDSPAIVLDFSRARDVSDLGIAVLARGLASDRVAVRLRGLSQHHERMLRYLGLKLEDLASPEAAG